ncbi:MAG: DUF433 domain-containing protein [Haloferacaceae archaeon]
MTEHGGRIVSDPSVRDGEPCVEGTRVGVYFLRERVEGRGLDPAAVADRHDLDVADVYRGLTYFHDHPDEMASVERERADLLAEASDDPTVATGPDDLGKPKRRS